MTKLLKYLNRTWACWQRCSSCSPAVSFGSLLPNLNADIINFGVIKGDTGYIWENRGYMLLFTFLLIFTTSHPATFQPALRWRSAKDVRNALFSKVETSP
jgi:hypothetical protein